MNKINLVQEAYTKKEVPKFNVGDTVKVFVKIMEEDKTRIQPFEGIVIKRSGKGVSQTFTLRRVSYGEGIERTFPVHSPFVEKISVIKSGKTRRAKLYYLRKKVGKKTKIEEAQASSEEKKPETSNQ